MTPDFWKGKRVFLTGHTGFKGSWLSLWLQKLGANLTGYALPPPTTPSLFDVANVAKGMTSLTGDIRDLSALKQVVQDVQPEIMIHMAAQSLVRASYEAPVETYGTNVMGTVHLLEAVRHTPRIKAVVIVTTDKCYENKEWMWGYRENDPMGGYDPYSSSKGCAELVTAAYRASFFSPENYKNHGVSIATVRAGNVIGGGDWSKDRLIPDILKAFGEGKSASIRNPHAVRPWQDVLDPLRGYLMLAEKLYVEGPAYAEAWNFGPLEDDVRPVSWIADQLKNLWSGGAAWTSVSPDLLPEAHSLKLDASKAMHQLGWRPAIRLPAALDHIVTWHRLFMDKADMREATWEQIHHYEKSFVES